MKELLEGIWNAPAEDVTNVIVAGLGIYAAVAIVIFVAVIAVFVKAWGRIGKN
jgi:hypothetical protein